MAAWYVVQWTKVGKEKVGNQLAGCCSSRLKLRCFKLLVSEQLT